MNFIEKLFHAKEQKPSSNTATGVADTPTCPQASVPKAAPGPGKAMLQFDCNYASEQQFNQALAEIRDAVPYGLSVQPKLVHVVADNRVLVSIGVNFETQAEVPGITQTILRILEARGLY